MIGILTSPLHKPARVQKPAWLKSLEDTEEWATSQEWQWVAANEWETSSKWYCEGPTFTRKVQRESMSWWKGISKELRIRGCSEQRENETALLWSERENAGELESGREGEQSRTKELKCLQKAGRWKKMTNKQECREGLHHPLRERAGLITWVKQMSGWLYR